MTQNFHTPIINDDPRKNDAAIWNDVSGELDAQLTTVSSEVVNARGAYPSVGARLNGLVTADDALQDAIDAIILDDGTGNAEVIAARNRLPYLSGSGPAILGDTIEYLSGQVANVMTFGATGDGVTDDSSSIQDAVDWAGANHGNIYFPPGIYVCNDILVPADRTFYSHGGATLLLTVSGPCLEIQDNNVLIRDIIFDSSIGGQAIFFDLEAGDISNVRVEKCRFSIFTDAINVRSRNQTGRTLSDVWITDCYFQDIGSQVLDMQINVTLPDVAQAYIVENLHFERNTCVDCAPESSTSGSSGSFAGIIYIGGITSISRFYLCDNTVYRAGPQFLALAGNLGAGRDFIVTGNVVRQQGPTNIIHMCYQFSNVDNMVFAHNSCYYVEFEHVYLSNCKNFRISDCHFEDGNVGIAIHDNAIGDKSWGVVNNCTFVDVECPPFSLRNSSYIWTLSGSGTNEYYLRTAAGGDPGLTEPQGVLEGGAAGALMIEATGGSLAASQWDWDDNDSLGYSTLYVRLSDGTDPDFKATDYVMGLGNIGHQAFYVISDNANVKISNCEFYKRDGNRIQSAIDIGYFNDSSPDPAAMWAEVFSTSEYTWTQDAASSRYYLRSINNTNPEIPQPINVYENGSALAVGTLGSLAVSQWAWGDNNSLGYSTIYVRLSDSTIPINFEVHAGYPRLGISISNCYFTKVVGIIVTSGGDLNYPGHAKITNCSFRKCPIAIQLSFPVGNIISGCSFNSCTTDIEVVGDVNGLRCTHNYHLNTNPSNGSTYGAYVIDVATGYSFFEITSCTFRNVRNIFVLEAGSSLSGRKRFGIFRDNDIDTASTIAAVGTPFATASSTPPTHISWATMITNALKVWMHADVNVSSGTDWQQGDWIQNSLPALGENTAWALKAAGATSNSEAVQSQVGYQTRAGTPNGFLTPVFIGELAFDSTNVQFYMATSINISGWKQITA